MGRSEERVAGRGEEGVDEMVGRDRRDRERREGTTACIGNRDYPTPIAPGRPGEGNALLQGPPAHRHWCRFQVRKTRGGLQRLVDARPLKGSLIRCWARHTHGGREEKGEEAPQTQHISIRRQQHAA